MSQPSAAAPPSGDDAPSTEVLIIGGGPAGLTAATYLARFRRRLVLLDGGQSRARWIPTSHNCPGFPLGVEGDQLLERYRQQARLYGVEPIEAQIARLDKRGGTFNRLLHAAVS